MRLIRIVRSLQQQAQRIQIFNLPHLSISSSNCSFCTNTKNTTITVMHTAAVSASASESASASNKQLEMEKQKQFRHAQTQHGDASVDEENIVLLKAQLFDKPDATLTAEDESVDCDGATLKTEETQCVWFYEVEPSVNNDEPLVSATGEKDKLKSSYPEKRKAEDSDLIKDLKKAKLETKALKAKRPGFTDERYYETSYYIENGLRKVYPYYFTFTTFTKGRWVGEKILDVFAREFRAHPAEEYERCIKAGTLTVNYDKVPIDYRLKHNDLLANIVHRHEVPVTSQPITIVHMDDDIVVVNKPASIPVSGF